MPQKSHMATTRVQSPRGGSAVHITIIGTASSRDAANLETVVNKALNLAALEVKNSMNNGSASITSHLLGKATGATSGIHFEVSINPPL